MTLATITTALQSALQDTLSSRFDTKIRDVNGWNAWTERANNSFTYELYQNYIGGRLVDTEATTGPNINPRLTTYVPEEQGVDDLLETGDSAWIHVLVESGALTFGGDSNGIVITPTTVHLRTGNGATDKIRFTITADVPVLVVWEHGASADTLTVTQGDSTQTGTVTTGSWGEAIDNRTILALYSYTINTHDDEDPMVYTCDARVLDMGASWQSLAFGVNTNPFPQIVYMDITDGPRDIHTTHDVHGYTGTGNIHHAGGNIEHVSAGLADHRREYQLHVATIADDIDSIITAINDISSGIYPIEVSYTYNGRDIHDTLYTWIITIIETTRE